MAKKPKILFLSTGSPTRSQIAEGFMCAMASDRFSAESASTESGAVNPLATEVMQEAGIDISERRPKELKQTFKEYFAYVITMYDPAEKSPTFPFTLKVVRWKLPDPSKADASGEEKKEMFRRARDEIRECVAKFLDDTVRNDRQRAA